jgi:general secretion pathway protein E
MSDEKIKTDLHVKKDILSRENASGSDTKMDPIDNIHAKIEDFYRERGKKPNIAIGEILLEYTRLTKKQLLECLEIQKEKGQKLGEILVQKNFLTPDEILKSLSIQLGIPYLDDIPASVIDLSLLKGLSITYVSQNYVIPLYKKNNIAYILISDPLKYYPLDDLRLLLKCEVRPIISSPSKIVNAINEVYAKITDTDEDMVGGLEHEEGEIDLDEPIDLLMASSDDEAPIIKLVYSLLFRAIKEKASDIHIEPYEKELVVRFRLDGTLREKMRLPKRFQANIISRIKIMGHLDIAEKRVPQDAGIPLKSAGKDIDVRLSVVPTVHGERIVMRLLDKSSVILDLETLGFKGPRLNMINKLINKTNGIILVCGPTGSGKSTTLSACVEKIKTPAKNIITVEDPVEHKLKGVGQIQVNPKVNLTFAAGLRSILRQDPNIIMVGEIRDIETAEIAIHASLTGHLVLSTIHTNDSAGAITRLVDMGIEPFLVSSSVLGVISQRLVKLLCPDCKEAFHPHEDLLREFTNEPEKYNNMFFYRSVGCVKCNGIGYVSRRAIFELLVIDEEIRSMILKNTDSFTIKKYANEKMGMRLMRNDGFLLATQGLTTLDEIMRETQEDQ